MKPATKQILHFLGAVLLAVSFFKIGTEVATINRLVESAVYAGYFYAIKASTDFILISLLFFTIGIGCFIISLKTENSEDSQKNEALNSAAEELEELRSEVRAVFDDLQATMAELRKAVDEIRYIASDFENMKARIHV